MATNFPESLDTLSNPDPNNPLSNPSHSQQHKDANDAIEAIQAKIGIDGSNDPSSLDYKISDIQIQLGGLGNSTDTITALLGLEGNNDLTITGVENKTTIDSFSISQYRSADYKIQISRNNSHYSSKISILSDGTNINVSESDIISNTEESLANITFEENSGIISLCVTPVGSAVTVRYYRTALKA